ncbi:uncharacterized protein C5orf47 homolog isoform X1 [Podarcis raffonei]|uniref:uncharacterized protein C5orf47 homolog isoform X1 n=1 Tax=Podarcis raffonei TaxID=65483 RepID=UPI0023290FD1|nr:uncharacterized protein C5orf47 homolog isoform X1 [Podarcis raffonei]
MKASSGLGRGRSRRVVYVNSFGSHRCGNVIRYGGGGHLRDPEASCLSGASPAASLSGRRGFRSAAGPPSGERGSPCLGLKAPGEARAKGVGRGWEEGGEAKRPRAERLVGVKPPPTPREGRSSKAEAEAANSTGSDGQEEAGGCKETQGDAFEFPPSWEVDNSEIRHQKKESTVWLGVCKVISKMIEENGHFRSRLLSCSELPSEGRDVNGNVQNETSCIDTDETIFGWV